MNGAMELPRITIVTPSYQQAAYLEQCLRSVHAQDYPALEHIVVDGGSTDGSVEVLQRWSHRLTAWSSGKDAGQSAAINKGLAQATGEVFAWLNSDDELVPGALHRVAAVFAEQPHLHTVTGARWRLELDGSNVLLPADRPDDHTDWAVRPRVNQSSTFMLTDRVRSVGGVDERLHHVMDLELWWQLLFKEGPQGIACVDEPLSIFRIHGASKTHAGTAAFVRETAWLLQQACTEVGAVELAAVLAIDAWRTDAARGWGLHAGQRPLVEQMAVTFLFKWFRHLHSASDLKRMKALGELVEQGRVDVEGHAAEWDAVRNELVVPGWWAHRIRRKWRSLRP